MAGNYFSSDTIAAIATSIAGDAGVGVIRISGEASLKAAQTICRGFDDPKPRYLHRIEIVDPQALRVIDDGLAVLFSGAHSFTGEAVVELQLHGGRFLLQSILRILIGSGLCRMALPGEFSFRAVRNGKLSLSGAEALGQIIGAKSMFEVQAARRNLGQSRTREFDEIAKKLRDLLAQCELSIDFIDQDVEVISADALSRELEALAKSLDSLLAQLRSAQRIAKGLQVTLVGMPNAGKSTLFNAVLSEERAIVSPVAGTTRDVITEDLIIGPYYVRLADTAGIRTAGGQIELEGINRAKELAAKSELVVLVCDTSQGEAKLAAAVAQARSLGSDPIVVLNKYELVSDTARGALVEKLGKIGVSKHVLVSAVSGAGIDRLLDLIRECLDARYGNVLDSFLPTEFQLQMLLQAKEALEQVRGLVAQAGLANPELISAGLVSSVRALSDLVGETTPDTVLAKIFSEFCIGK